MNPMMMPPQGPFPMGLPMNPMGAIPNPMAMPT